jgi:hypothetical protein
MKKILFGIALMLMRMAFVFVGEFKNILVVSEDFEAILCALLPILGFLCVFGDFLKRINKIRFAERYKENTKPS